MMLPFQSSKPNKHDIKGDILLLSVRKEACSSNTPATYLEAATWNFCVRMKLPHLVLKTLFLPSLCLVFYKTVMF